MFFIFISFCFLKLLIIGSTTHAAIARVVFLVVAKRITIDNGKITAKSCVSSLILPKRFVKYGKVKNI